MTQNPTSRMNIITSKRKVQPRVPSSSLQLKPVWRRIFLFNWCFGLFLLVLLCVPRFILALQANATGRYSLLGMVMVASAVLPLFFLSRIGRTQIGITKPGSYRWLIFAFVLGLFASMMLYGLGQLLYPNTYANWFVYIGRSYQIPAAMPQNDKAILFAVMAFTSITFSPIGEELFFRGIVHESLANSMGDNRASMVDSSAFAAVHLSHFGFVFLDQRWIFLTIPAAIWVGSMFLVSRLFWLARKKSGSILGAISCHAGFNLGMTYSIFYLLNPV